MTFWRFTNRIIIIIIIIYLTYIVDSTRIYSQWMHWATVQHSDIAPCRSSQMSFFMVALWNRETIYIFMLWFVLLLLLSFFFSSPNLSRRRLDVCNTSTHGVALVRI